MSARILRKLLLYSLVFMALFVCHEEYFATSVVSVQAADPVVFFFHNYSEIYHSENGSMFVYNGADTEPPLARDGTTTVLRCEILQNVQYSFFSFDAYLGVVSWVTQPLFQDYDLDGVVTLQVCLSSNDTNVSGTGYGMGIADLDENGNLIRYFYNYRYTSGTILSTEPGEYGLQVSVDHVFAKAHKLAFEVAVGSTKLGWSASVYFDSPNRDSKAILPSEPLVISEFEKETLTVSFCVMIITLFFVSRRRWKRLRR